MIENDKHKRNSKLKCLKNISYRERLNELIEKDKFEIKLLIIISSTSCYDYLLCNFTVSITVGLHNVRIMSQLLVDELFEDTLNICKYKERSEYQLFEYFLDSNESNSNPFIRPNGKYEDNQINISTRLAACFLGGCRTASTSAIHVPSLTNYHHNGRTTTSNGIHSSILESDSLSLLDTMRASATTALDTSLFQIVPNYEMGPRAFCHVDKVTVAEPPSRYVLNKQSIAVVEVDDFSIRRRGESMTNSCEDGESAMGSMPLIADVHSDPSQRTETRSILKSSSFKSNPPAHLTFALGRNLVSIFEYPSYESLLEENDSSVRHCGGPGDRGRLHVETNTSNQPPGVTRQHGHHSLSPPPLASSPRGSRTIYYYVNPKPQKCLRRP